MKTKLWWVLLVAVLFLLLVSAGLWAALAGRQSLSARATPIESGIPPELGGMPLVDALAGDEGLHQVNRMHGQEIDLVRGFSAQYASSGFRATLWVGWAEDDVAAQKLTDRMTARIGPSHPVFQDLQALTVAGRMVYAMTGQGQQHYYFRSGAAAVWLAADGAIAQATLHDVLRRYP